MSQKTRSRSSTRRRRELSLCEPLETRRLLALIAPALSSLPGAPRTIYLDFVGSPAFSWNDGNNDYSIHGPGNNNAPVPAYDEDGNQTTFNATEQSDITNIWSWVAEKYSPFIAAASFSGSFQ